MAKVFDGTEGTFISKADGKTMANRHISTPYAYFFGKDKLQQLLNQSGTMGIRIYYGANVEGEPALVLVSADEDGNDMTSLVLDVGIPCPKTCSSSSSSLR